MSYFSHLYKCRETNRQFRRHKPDANKFGDLRAAIFAKLYEQSNEWEDLRNITERTMEQRRRMSVGKLRLMKDGKTSFA